MTSTQISAAMVTIIERYTTDNDPGLRTHLQHGISSILKLHVQGLRHQHVQAPTEHSRYRVWWS
jgi:hypothetical protein